MVHRPNPGARRRIQIMDTTLRDGEQTFGVSIAGHEKLLVAQELLGKVGVDRVEVASCRVSKGEQESLGRIMEWAARHGHEDQVEVLSFVDGTASVEWMTAAGCRRMNLLTKGSRHHCERQLRKSLADHLEDIAGTLAHAVEKGVTANIYLEAWSNGMIEDETYVFEMLDAITEMAFERIHLCDTLGVLSPHQVRDFVGRICARYPGALFEYHGHNDYGLATANTLAAVEVGAVGVHTTVNGLGERAGNTSLAEAVAGLRDHLGCEVGVDETKLKEVSRLVEAFSGKRISSNTPIIGNDVFTQTAGIHADGDMKANLYESRLTPQRFARDRVYALGKLSGRSNLDFNLDKLDLDLSPEQRKTVLQRIIELGDRKKTVTTEDLPFLIADLFSTPGDADFKVIECVITTSVGMKPAANIRVRLHDREYDAVAHGNGGYDAFMVALRSLAPEMGIEIPLLEDFEIHIPPGGRTNALVECTITWEGGIKTRAVSSDQVLASVAATERMINLKLKTPAERLSDLVKRMSSSEAPAPAQT